MFLPPLDDCPLVSIIVANHNYARFVGEAIESVLTQTCANLEVLVVDDGSTDDSRDVLQSLASRNPRISLLWSANHGQAAAWYLAFQHSRGDIICFLDSDDTFLPTKLEQVVAAFRSHPRAGVVYHPYQPTTSTGEPRGAPFPRKLESGWLMPAAMRRGGWGPEFTSSVLCLRREVALQIFPLPDDLLPGFGDAYIQGIAQFMTEFVSLPEALTRYRIHGANDSGSLVPTIATLTVMANARREVFPHIRAYVAANFDAALASRLRVEDIPSYWDYLAALYVMRGKPTDGVHGYTRSTILAHLPRSPRRFVWRSLFALPGRIARGLFRTWWRASWWKRYSRPVTNLLRLG
jgi:glycosyltransferase involved in cell wall biosynthesis